MTASIDRAVSVRALARVLQEWPHSGADGNPTLVLLGDAFPDATTPPQPVVSAGAIELDDGGSQHIVLFPPPQEIPRGADGETADALDLALAALAYQLTTPMAVYDPYRANELAIRAVTAIDTIKRLERRLFL